MLNYSISNIEDNSNSNYETLRILRISLLHGCFLRFLSCTNVAKSHKASHVEFNYFCFTNV